MLKKMGNLFKKKPKHDPDAGWRLQNEQAKVNPVYKLANLNKEGLIIDLYNEGGMEAVEQFAREKMPYFLYSGGKGGVITKTDYARWITKCQTTETTSIIDGRTDDEVLSDFQQNGFNEVVDHDACWDLNKRGAVGETLLHLLFLNGTPVHLQIAEVILDMYPKLSLDVYEGDEYFGESCLHLAIVTGDIQSVKRLVEAGADINQRATGSFFLPEDQKKKKNVTKTNYEGSRYGGYSYFGEYPLAFAASHGYDAIYDYLIEQGADPNLQDSFGNTVLHLVVINNQTDMYRYAVKHHKKTAKDNVQNAAGLTPLTLACKIGRIKIFNEITLLSNKECWRFSNITCSVYPLLGIDTIGPHGTTDFNSALMIIVNGEKDEHLEMLEGGVIRQLLDEKWNSFARRHFFRRLALTTAHMTLMTIAVYTRPRDALDPAHPEKYLLERTDEISILRYVCEVIVTGGSFWTFVLQFVEVKSVGLLRFIKNLKNAPAKAIFMVASIMILMCVPFRFLNMPLVEESLLALAIPGTWSFYLFYAKSVPGFGPYVQMMYLQMSQDMLKFGIILFVFYLQFMGAFFLLYKDIDKTSHETITTFHTVDTTVMSLIKMTLGDFDYSEFNKTKNSYMTKLVFTLFMFLVPVLLMNMLIAMMGQTYQQVIAKSEKEWRRQWAKIVIVLERAFKSQELSKIQSQYSVPIAGADSSEDLRGLTVIAMSKKTKAKQKKGAMANWKWMYKETRKRIKMVRQIGKFEGDINYLDVFESDEAHVAARKLKNGRPLSAESTTDFGQAISQLAWEKDIDFGTFEEVRKELQRRKSVAAMKLPAGLTPTEEHKPPKMTPHSSTVSGRRRSSSGTDEFTSPRKRAIKNKTSKSSLNEDWGPEVSEAIREQGITSPPVVNPSPPRSSGHSSSSKRSSKVAPLSPSVERQDSTSSFTSVLEALDRNKEKRNSSNSDARTEETDL